MLVEEQLGITTMYIFSGMTFGVLYYRLDPKEYNGQGMYIVQGGGTFVTRARYIMRVL